VSDVDLTMPQLGETVAEGAPNPVPACDACFGERLN
jgi:hypothetical protein